MIPMPRTIVLTSVLVLASCGAGSQSDSLVDGEATREAPSALLAEAQSAALAAGGSASCPQTYTLDSASRLCVKGTSALGPFTEAMKAECVTQGGGDACQDLLWNANFARWIRGGGPCMKGAIRGADGVCVEGTNAFGPFSSSMIAKCKAAGAGPACDTMRWSASLARNLADHWDEIDGYSYGKGKIRSYIGDNSEWTVDLRVVTPSKRFIILQNRPDEGFIPASTNKITSAISAHINAKRSWSNMAWWIKQSNNDASERAWSDGGGRAGVVKALASLGVTPPNTWKNVDGSGLSYSNAIPSSFLVEILLAVRRQPWYSEFRAALPEGCRSGTMVSMFCQGVASGRTIQAKTGTLNTYVGVKGLAGFGLTEKGNLLIFTTIYNGPAGTAWSEGQPRIEGIVKEAIRIAASVN